MIRAPLILASASPRRRDLLAEMGVAFETRPAAVVELDKRTAAHFTASELALANARLKAEAVAKENPGRWIFGADTVVALEDRIFGKPADLAEAKIFLSAMSGRTHQVVTGCVLLSNEGEETAFAEETLVTFQKLVDIVIDRYLAAVEVLDKAGAYALQEHPEMIIAAVRGSRNNVVGLPTERLAALFCRHGLL